MEGTSTYSSKLANTEMHVTAALLFDELQAILKDSDVQWRKFIRLCGDENAEISRISLAGDPVMRPDRETLLVSLGQQQDLGTCRAWIDAPALSEAEASSLLNAAWDALSGIWRWSAQVSDALLEGRGPAGLLALGESTMGCAMALFGSDLGIIAASPGYATTLEKNSFGDLSLPESRAKALMEDPSFLDVAYVRDLILYPTEAPPDELVYLAYNHMPDDSPRTKWDARLVIRAGPMSNWRERIRLLHAVPYFAEKVFESMDAAQAMTHTMRSQSDAMHSLLRTLKSGNEAFDASLIDTALELYGWRHDDTLVALTISFFEGSMWATAIFYLCSVLEERWPGSCALAGDGSITVVVDLDHREWSTSVDALVESLSESMADYAFKLGLSNPFKGIENIERACRQAEIALEYGSMAHPRLWHYSFSECTFTYMMSQMKGEFEPSELCHPGIKALVQHDAEHGTSYVETLGAYLESHLNATHAAERLFVHRSSMLRRLDRIEKITGIDFDDSDQMLHVILSLRMLRGA